MPELAVVLHERNRGYGGALISAFSAATKEWIFYTDGDAQYDAREAAVLVDAVTPTTDIVQGYKIGRGDSWYRKVIGRIYHHVVKAGVPAARAATPTATSDCSAARWSSTRRCDRRPA